MAGLEGTRLGDYELVERIGSGGMAEVYRAKQRTAFGREVALKVVRADFSEREEFRARFLREARAISRLAHPNILPLIEFGDEDGALYLVTPLVRGGTLRDLLRQRGGALALREAGLFFAQLCQAVQYAHEEGIIHRDIKPQNILLQQRAYVVLADFGIARDRSAEQITAVKSGIGTADYMAPEQAIGQADPRSDIYSLGVVLYLMLTGHLPYEGSTPLHILARHSSEPLPDPRAYNPDLPPALVEILQTAMAKRPDERFQSASALGNAVQQVIDDAAPRARSILPGGSSITGDHASQENRPPGISVSLPSVESVPPASADTLETRPQPGAERRPSQPEGRPPGISVSLTDTNPDAHAQPGTLATLPTSDQTEKAQNPPLAYPGNPPTQQAFVYAPPPMYQSSGSAPPPAAYAAGPLPPAPKHRPRGRLLLLGLLALIVVAGGVGVFVLKVWHPAAGTTTGQTLTPTPTIPSGFRLFTSPDHSFSIIYPEAWAQSATPAGVGAQFSGPVSQMLTAVNEGPAQAGEAAQNDDNFCTTLSGASAPRTAVTIGGQQWTQEVCDAPLGLAHSVSASIVYKGHLYWLLYTDAPDSFSSDNRAYFSLMQRSFTFLI